MKKQETFKKQYGNQATSGYSKEYMKVYCKWLHTLSKTKRQSIKDCNIHKPKTKKEKRQNKLYEKIVNGLI